MENQAALGDKSLSKGQQPSVNQPMTKKIVKDEEETKISEQFSNMTIKDDIAQIDEENQKNFTGKCYTLVHTTDDWEFVSETIKPLAKGKATLGDVLSCIEKFTRNFYTSPEATNLNNLKDYFSSLNAKRKSDLEDLIFPGIAKIILKTPELFPNKIPLLVQGKSQKVKFSKEQCACLLSHMFMCTTIRQASQNMPNGFNFAEIFTKTRFQCDVKQAKISCVLNYFRRVFTEIRPTYVIFERLLLKDNIHGQCTLAAWKECKEKIGRAEIRAQGKIEDAEGAIEIDFANKFIGGGVMRNGAAQEEIQFATSPELLISVLLFEVMGDKEAISMRGAEIYCNHKGYLDKFRYDCDYTDMRTAVIDGVLDREVTAIDAISFKNEKAPPQFSEVAVLRELNKAYVGFYGAENKADVTVNKPISTGKWGCGVFKGNTQLKFLIQWVACSRAKRDMAFYSFGDHKEFKDVEPILNYYKDKKIGELVEDILKCCKMANDSGKENPEIFSTLIRMKSIQK